MKLHHLLQVGIALSPGLLGVGTGAARLLTVPATPFEESSGDYSLSRLGSIVVDSQHAEAVDENGQTLIPPTLQQFAETVQEDLKSAIGIDLSLSTGPKPVEDSIFFTLENNTAFTDAAGRHTSEGYSLTVKDNGIVIAGASPLGAWWGTRSLIQAAVVGGKMSLPQGSGVDAPGWATRGAFLDTARQYFPPEFLIEMCSYLSFFKQNTFHIHLSDNVIFVADRYSREYALDNFYGAFRLWSDEPAVAGLNQRANESYTRGQFDEIQAKCARRGVTIVPEIEAPGHALVFTQWKPEMGLEDPTMLNISFPQTIPTMKTVWETFLPWFHSKDVHIGADEYESDEVEAYASFVDQMNSFIRKEGSRRVRLWGTFTPAQGCNVSREVSYQHWSHLFDNPYFDYIRNGYDVLNTDDAFYMVGKSQVSYPQTLNKTRVFHGNPTGGAYEPNIFDTNNATNNPPRDNPKVLGHLTALWNDYGPNATSVVEAYYGFRNILPALGDKQWGGDLQEDEYDSVFDKLHAAIPGQNLDRQIHSKSELILSYNFDQDTTDIVKDSSGNGYDGHLHGCQVKQSALHLSDGCYLRTPLGSKGRDYTLSFSVKPTSSTPGSLFEGPDSILVNGNGTMSNVTMITGGNAYPLNYSLPLDTWTDVSLVGKGGHTFLQVSSSDEANEPTKMEFKTHVGVVGRSMAWAQIAIDAPVATIGKGFTGMMKNIKLKDG